MSSFLRSNNRTTWDLVSWSFTGMVVSCFIFHWLFQNDDSPSWPSSLAISFYCNRSKSRNKGRYNLICDFATSKSITYYWLKINVLDWKVLVWAHGLSGKYDVLLGKTVNTRSSNSLNFEVYDKCVLETVRNNFGSAQRLLPLDQHSLKEEQLAMKLSEQTLSFGVHGFCS